VLSRGSGFRVQGFWLLVLAAADSRWIRFIGLIGLIRSIGSVYTNPFNQ
jgi:hypothetical protein